MEEYTPEPLVPGYIGFSFSEEDDDIYNICFVDDDGAPCFLPTTREEALAVDRHIVSGEAVDFPKDGIVNADLLYFLVNGRHMTGGTH